MVCQSSALPALFRTVYRPLLRKYLIILVAAERLRRVHQCPKAKRHNANEVTEFVHWMDKIKYIQPSLLHTDSYNGNSEIAYKVLFCSIDVCLLSRAVWWFISMQ